MRVAIEHREIDVAVILQHMASEIGHDEGNGKKAAIEGSPAVDMGKRALLALQVFPLAHCVKTGSLLK